MKIYLAGAIADCTDSQMFDWRKQARTRLIDLWTDRFPGGIQILDPTVRDYRGYSNDVRNEIVMLDKEMILSSDVVLAKVEKPSWGTAMEILFAHQHNKIVVSFGAGEYPSPWVQYHSARMEPDLSAACNWIDDKVFQWKV